MTVMNVGQVTLTNDALFVGRLGVLSAGRSAARYTDNVKKVSGSG